tara:strand:+ start:273 stop:560 length:288 start_codon:yes stop_codon:yes gene_type:complete
LLFAAFDGAWRQWFLQIAGGLLCCIVGIVAYILGYYILFILLPYLGVGYIVCTMWLDWPSPVQSDDVVTDMTDIPHAEAPKATPSPQLYIAVDNM